MFLVVLLSLLFLSNAQLLNADHAAEAPGFLFHFFGTLCLLALLDLNARRVFSLLRHLQQMLFGGGHAPHHPAH